MFDMFLEAEIIDNLIDEGYELEAKKELDTPDENEFQPTLDLYPVDFNKD